MFWKKRLAVKMSLYILSGIITVVLLIVLYNYHVSKKLILTEAKNNAINLCESTLYQVENILLPAQKIPENLSFIVENSSFTKEELENFLRIIVKKNQDIFGSCIAFEPYVFLKNKKDYAPYGYHCGDSVCFKDLSMGDYKYFDWDWYTLAKKEGSGWGEPYFDKGGGNTIMATYHVPMYNVDDPHRFEGAVTVDISLGQLRTLIDKMKIFDHGYAFLISGQGVYISHPDSSVVINESIFSFAATHDQPELATIGRQMIKGKTDFQKYYSQFLHEEGYIFYTSLRSTNWSLAIVIPKDEALEPIYDLNKSILFIGLAGILTILAIIIIISKRITNPLEKLVKATRETGSGNFDFQLPEIRSKDEIGQLSESFLVMQDQLKDYIRNLKEVTAAREKIESELKIAHDIQQGIVPKLFPPYPERNDIDIHAVLIPAREVGGDLYDYFFIDEDILAVTVGDVSGKGVPAALLMAITRTLFRSRTRKNMQADEIVRDINSNLCRDNKNAMFVSLFLGLIDLKKGEIHYCNAGHNYPFIVSTDGKVKCLDQTHGTPLGLFEDQRYGYGNIMLNNKDFFILYTDGVTEAMDRDGNLFGEDRLKSALEKFDDNKTVGEITRNILDSMREFTKGAEQSDDITILALNHY